MDTPKTINIPEEQFRKIQRMIAKCSGWSVYSIPQAGIDVRRTLDIVERALAGYAGDVAVYPPTQRKWPFKDMAINDKLEVTPTDLFNARQAVTRMRKTYNMKFIMDKLPNGNHLITRIG